MQHSGSGSGSSGSSSSSSSRPLRALATSYVLGAVTLDCKVCVLAGRIQPFFGGVGPDSM